MNRGLLIVPLALALAGCTSTPTPEPTSAAPTASASDDCLVGEWITPPGATQQFMTLLASELRDLPDDAVTADGPMSVRFDADGTFFYAPEVTFTLHWLKGGDQQGRIDGNAAGTWTTKDGTLFATATQNTLKFTADIPGDDDLTTDLHGWAKLPITASDYECGDGVLDMTFNVGVASLPIELVPAT
jgi:hypothetical protein